VFVTFLHCDKIPEKTNLKEEEFILAHSFRGLCPWLVGSIAMGLWLARTSWQQECVTEEATRWWAESGARQRKRKMCYTLQKSTLILTHFLQSGTTFHTSTSTNSPFNYKSINGLIP
jgi:hypothetical protein